MQKTFFQKSKVYRFRRFARKAYSAFNSMHRLVNIGVVAGCMLSFAHATQTSAQSRTDVSGESFETREKELDELIVTSTKAELSLAQAAKVVTVITCAEIERQPVRSIQDLLKNVVGLDIRQRGSNGVLAGISVRGGTFEQTAVLLNGANITNPQTAHYTLDIPVNLSDIEYIEIIQGPTSLLYGAGAFSGGINIVTKKESATGFSVNAEGGMHQSLNVGIRGSLAGKSSSHSLSADYSSSDGYIDNSDYKIFNAFWQSCINSDNSKLDFQLGFNDKSYGANTFYSAQYPNQFDDTRSLFASLKGEAGTRLKFTPQLYWKRHYDTYHLFRRGTPDIPDWYKNPNYHRTDVFGFNLNTHYKWQAGTTNLGGEIRNEGIYSSVLGKPLDKAKGNYLYSDNRTNISFFLEHTYLYQGFTLGVGALANYNTAFEDNFDFFPSINAAYWLTDNLKVFASWNNATRMPTFTDLYYKGKTHKGNSDVRPEKSESVELGAKYLTSHFSASFTGFYMEGKNLIDWVKERPDELWESRNLTDLYKTGLEANISFDLQTIFPKTIFQRLDLGYMYMNQSKESGDLISNYVLDYLKHKFTVGLSHRITKSVTVDWQFRWQDRQGTYTKYEDLMPAYEASYRPFGILDLKIDWSIRKIHLYLTANNLFDTNYYDIGNIPQPGFWCLLGIKYEL